MPDVQFTDRYEALGIPRPSTLTCCTGSCEGTGHVPVFIDTSAAATKRGASGCRPVDEELDPRLRELWQQAEATHPTDDGWHFVRCPDCEGTGKRPDPITPTLESQTAKVRDLRDIQGQDGNWNASGYMRGLYNGLEMALAILEGEREPQFRDGPSEPA
jgi:hypothetical protein